MGISMAICELDCDESLCKKPKLNVLKARVDSVQGLEAAADYDEVVRTADAKSVFQADFDAFAKRNRIDPDAEIFLMTKVKKEEDATRLKPVAQKVYTGWLVLSKLPKGQAEEIVKRAGEDNLMTEWNTIPLEETNAICGRCAMSWDKGRGCIGSFGPENSQLPEIAKKYSCRIVSQIPELAKSRAILSATDAKALAEECKVLREKLPAEGKAPARRYGGVVDRLEAMANLCAQHGVRFYFL